MGAQGWEGGRCGRSKKSSTLLDLCVSSLRRGHANLLCIVPILTDVPRKESRDFQFHRKILPGLRSGDFQEIRGCVAEELAAKRFRTNYPAALGRCCCTPATTSALCGTKTSLLFSICACHPCAGAMLIFSVSFQF